MQTDATWNVNDINNFRSRFKLEKAPKNAVTKYIIWPMQS